MSATVTHPREAGPQVSDDETERASRAVAAAAANRRAGQRRVVLVAGALAAGLAVAGYWVTHRGLESTDDAQVDADLLPVAARTGGTVVAVRFEDNQEVTAGLLLIEIDPAPAKAKLAQAEAELGAAKAAAEAAQATASLTEASAKGGKRVAEASLQGASVAVAVTSGTIAEARAQATAAKANRDKTKSDFDRTQALVDTGSISASQLESARAALDESEAALTQANARVATMQASTSQAQTKVSEASARLVLADTIDAQIAEARAKAAVARERVGTAEALRDLAALELSYTRIVAPRAGVVSKRTVAVGQTIAAGQTTLTIVPTDAVWVTANFKETQLRRMKVGQPAKISVDAYGGRELRGQVESFSGATGARFALLPPDNATGNFTKIVQRMPVRIKLLDPPRDLLLRPGLSVELSVDTRN